MEIRELEAVETEEAAHVVARAMRDNPIDVMAWRVDENRRQRALVRLFRVALRRLSVHGSILGAFDGTMLAGVCGMAAPGGCQLRFIEKLRFVPCVLSLSSPMVPFRLSKVEAEWARRDLPEAHWHLGPVAVDARLQGCGIGSRMLTAFCQRMDALGALAYLEADKEKNVGFYEKFGFGTVGQNEILGVRCWYMKREPRSG